MLNPTSNKRCKYNEHVNLRSGVRQCDMCGNEIKSREVYYRKRTSKEISCACKTCYEANKNLRPYKEEKGIYVIDLKEVSHE